MVVMDLFSKVFSLKGIVSFATTKSMTTSPK
jgi:hypothetical protein